MTSRIFLLSLLLGTHLWGCVCSGEELSIRQAWSNATVVFLGTVELASPDGDPRETEFQPQEVRVRVDTAFKGVRTGQTVVLHQAGTDCDAKFRTGQHWVFYLRGKTLQSLVVPWCTRAFGNASPEGDDMLFLRKLPKSAVGTRLSGEVDLDGTGVAGVRVTVSGPAGFRKEVLTNSAGAYELYGLSPGIYAATAKIPAGMKLSFPIISGSKPVPGNDAAVDLLRDGAAGIGFFLQADTRLNVRVVGAEGQPINLMCFMLEPVEKPGNGNLTSFACSKTDGKLQMEMMPPGKYWLISHEDVNEGTVRSRSTLYYPGVRDRNKASVISVEAGKYQDLNVRMPVNEQRRMLTGYVHFADGAPARDVTVAFNSPEHGYSESISSGADGAFRLSVVAGMGGQLNAQLAILEVVLKSCPEFKDARRQTGLIDVLNGTPVSVSGESDLRDINLKIPSSSCKAWPPGQK